MDTNVIRKDFPIFDRKIHGHPLIYLDNSATSQKPQQVIEAMANYYYRHNANVHRGVHTLSNEDTEIYHQAKQTIASFIGAQNPDEIIITKNSTEAVNLISYSWGLTNIHPNDEILVTELEHHSNLIPWQRVCQKQLAKLIICPIEGNGDLAISHLISLVGEHTKLIAITAVSNVLGTIVDIKHLSKALRQAGYQGKILVDGAQSVPHMPTHIQDLKIDFLVFSGHKMLGPQGIGCLWVKKEILNQLEPLYVGGGMINKVYADHATWADIPDKFDAGTPNVAGAVGLAAACDYLSQIGMDNVYTHEQNLLKYGLTKFAQLANDHLITLYGLQDALKRSGIITFNVTNVHAHDTAQILDRKYGIAVRSGHHCNQLLTDKLGVPATVRASVYLYNTTAEIDQLITGIKRVKEIILS